MDTPPDNLRRYTPVSVDPDELVPEEPATEAPQVDAEPETGPGPEDATEAAEAAPGEDTASLLAVPPPPVAPDPQEALAAPARPGRLRGALAAVGALALPVGVPLVVAALGALSICLWLRHEPKLSDAQPRTTQPMASPSSGPPGMGQSPLGSPMMGAPAEGGPGMGSPDMGAPGMMGPGDGGQQTGLQGGGFVPGGPGNSGSLPGPTPGGGVGQGMGMPPGQIPGPGSMGGGPGRGFGRFTPPSGPGGDMMVRPARPGRGGHGDMPGPTSNQLSPSASIPGTWPGYRGPNHDGVSPDTVELARGWGAAGPRKLWQAKMGEGYAGPAVINGRAYVLDYDQAARADKLRCLELATGRELWSQAYPVEVKRNHGMSRTVPAVTSQYVVTLGPKCHVLCCDATSGTVKWRLDLVRDWGAKVPTWYAGQCPLIDGNRLILAPGGKALMMAVDLASGKVLWKTPNPSGWQMTHSSILPTTIGGQRMYVYPASGGVVGVSASTGQELWRYSQWTVSTANIPQPIAVGDGRIFLSGGYNAGAMMLKVSKSGAGFTTQSLFRVPATTFGSDQQTPVLYKGYIYGVIPSGELACLDLSGKSVWRSGSTRRFGLGAYMIAGGMIYVVDDNGQLSLVQASPAGFKQLATAKVLNGPDAWGPMALVSGRLLVRDLTNLVCLDVRKA
jgi:outer membrane protein assembly factor BamB